MYFDKKAGKKLLFDMADALEDLHIPFFLMQGTALGAYRDKDFVPSELDVDIGVMIEVFDAAAICYELINKNIAVETRDRHKPYCKAHTIVAYVDGAKADIVGLMRYKNKRFTCTPDNPIEVLNPYAVVHEAELLENYQEISFFGRTFNIPSKIEQYLELEYGEDWRTPRADHVSRMRIYNFLKIEGIV